ncbi:MAG: DUF4936 family protein [Sulfuriferula sp.]
MHYYVYYRVYTDDAETELQIRSMQARLGCRCGVYGYLLKRREDPLTWMEVYESIANGATFERHMNHALSESDATMFINGNRVTECFLSSNTASTHCRA